MGLFNKKIKSEERTFYTVKIGYRSLNFTTLEDAMKVYQVLSVTPFVNLESKMIDEAVAKEKTGYRPYKNYHFIGRSETISMDTEKVEIFSEAEVKNLAETREKELEKIDAKSKKR